MSRAVIARSAIFSDEAISVLLQNAGFIFWVEQSGGSPQ